MVRQVFQAYSSSFLLYIVLCLEKKSILSDLALLFSILLIKCTDIIIITRIVHVLTLF